MIQRKKKICKGSCKQPCLPFSKGMCLQCWNKAFNKPLKPSKAKIKPINDKRQERLEKYYKIRDAYFLEHPICEFPGCNSKELTCHHRSGRNGQKLYEDLCSLCNTHHRLVEENPLLAKELGLSYSRLN